MQISNFKVQSFFILPAEFCSVHNGTCSVILLCMLLKSHNATFLVQFGNNLYSCFLQKAQIAFALRAHATLVLFEKPYPASTASFNHGAKEGKETLQKSCSSFVVPLSKNLDNEMHKFRFKTGFLCASLN